MTTYTDEVNIYNPDAIGDAIDDAGNAYKTYITEVTSDGIMVAAAGKGTSNGTIVSTTTGWHLSDVLEWVRNGVSRFWIGLKNQGDTTPTVRIGKAYVNGASDNESHMELDYHSMKLVDKDGNTYFHVSDLRETDGYARLTEVFVGDGDTRTFSVLATPRSNETSSVSVDGVTVSFTRTQVPPSKNFLLASAPANGSEISISYQSSNSEIKAYTIGTRSNDGRLGLFSVAEGIELEASGYASHAEGWRAKATYSYAHAEGSQTKARGGSSHAEGLASTASGEASHAEGLDTTASGEISHAEGNETIASGMYAHAEGTNTRATEYASHAEGYYAAATGFHSHAQNEGTYTGRYAQTAIGTYNVKDWDDPAAAEPSPPTTHPSEDDSYGKYALIIGNGTADNARSNALAVGWDGSVAQWDPNIDMTTVPSSAIYNRMLEVFDKNGDPIGWIQASQDTGGGHSFCIGASNSDDSAQNQIHLGYDANDNATAWVSEPAVLRNALGVNDSGWQTLTLGSAAAAYDTDNAPRYRKCFNVVNLIGSVKPKSNVAAGGSFDVGQLPSGYRPKLRCCTVCQGSGNSVYLLSIATGGTITIERYRNGASANAAMSTSTWLPFNVTFICA